jgi:F1F0 ATPase subunit 2
MSEAAYLVLAGFEGALLGAVFFGGLWWTVHKGIWSKQPATWFLASLAVRTLIAVSGFWLIARGDWRRLVACLLGFIVSKMIIVHLTAARIEKESQRLREGEA